MSHASVNPRVQPLYLHLEMLRKMLRHVPGKLVQQRFERGVGRPEGHASPQAEIDDAKVSRILRHFQRQIDIRAVPPEPRRRNAHDFVVLPVEL